MRRGLIRAALSILVAVLPMLVEVGSATAQMQLNTIPAGPIAITNTQVTVANSITSTTLASFTIPMRYFQNLKQPLIGATGLHLVLIGTITTNVGSGAQGAMNLGCNFGGTTASISLINAATTTPAGLVAAPFIVDVRVRASAAVANGQFLHGMASIAGPQTGAAAFTSYAAAVYGTTPTTANQTLSCAWMWGSAAATNALTLNSASLTIGD